MKYKATAAFLADWRHLTAGERRLFMEAVRAINDTYARRGERRLPRWPAHLRIKSVSSHPGVWEMTWSFAGPDGRATFDLIEVDRAPAIQ